MQNKENKIPDSAASASLMMALTILKHNTDGAGAFPKSWGAKKSFAAVGFESVTNRPRRSTRQERKQEGRRAWRIDRQTGKGQVNDFKKGRGKCFLTHNDYEKIRLTDTPEDKRKSLISHAVFLFFFFWKDEERNDEHKL